MSDEITLAEVVRSINRMESTLERQRDMFVLASVYHSEKAGIERRLTEIDEDIKQDRDDRKTLWRLVLGSFALPFLLIVVETARALGGLT